MAETSRHDAWQAGDIVIWDNRCLVHKAAGDYPPDQDR
ncbi:MAG: TauD/TfdA family dioxygenase, partial [Alphaproteobacteria bacterium]